MIPAILTDPDRIVAVVLIVGALVTATACIIREGLAARRVEQAAAGGGHARRGVGMTSYIDPCDDCTSCVACGARWCRAEVVSPGEADGICGPCWDTERPGDAA